MVSDWVVIKMEFHYQTSDGVKSVRIERDEHGDYHAIIGDKTYSVRVLQSASGEWTLALDDRILHGYTARDKQNHYIALNGETFTLQSADPDKSKRRAVRGDSANLTAPMPGQVTRVLVQDGETVTRGQALVLIEAMKMEIRITAPGDAQIAKVLVTQGEIVERGQKLIAFQAVE